MDRNAAEISPSAAARLEQASRKVFIIYSKLTPIVYTSAVPHGVRLTMRFLCEVRRQRGTAQAVWEDLLRAFARHDDIRFAYPTQRIVGDWERVPQEPRAEEVAG